LRSFQLPQYLSSLLGGCSFLSNWEKVEPWHWLKCHLDSSSSSNEKVLSVSVESVGLSRKSEKIHLFECLKFKSNSC
jgi:hypothetical protein